MFPEFRAVHALFLFVPLWLAMAGMSASQNTVQLAPGDTIMFSVLGAPHLDRDSTIDMDGTVFLPVAGKISASGLTIDELRDEIAVVLRDRVYRVMGAGGEDVWRRMQEDELFLDIREYRPVYVTGDVRNPGEVRFRPGLSVRQAMAVAGGVGRPLEERSDDEITRLLAERNVFLGRIAAQAADVERYTSDLDEVLVRLTSADGADTETSEGLDGQVSASEIGETAQRWLEAREDLRNLTEKGNELVLDRMGKRLEVLEALEDAGEQNLGIVEDELARVNQLAERGVVPTSRITEAQSSLLQASTRALETSGEVLRLRLDMTRFAEDARAILTTEQVRLLDQVLDGTDRLDDLRRQLGALDTRLALLGAITVEDQEASVEMVLFRAEAGTSAEGEVARPGMTLFPGDVLEITLTLPDSGIATQ